MDVDCVVFAEKCPKLLLYFAWGVGKNLWIFVTRNYLWKGLGSQEPSLNLPEQLSDQPDLHTT
jgi:hypothetical protein